MTDSVAGVRTRARRVQRVHGWLVRRLVCACTGVWPCRRCVGRQPVGEPRGDRERCVEPEREPRRVGAHRGCERSKRIAGRASGGVGVCPGVRKNPHCVSALSTSSSFGCSDKREVSQSTEGRCGNNNWHQSLEQGSPAAMTLVPYGGGGGGAMSPPVPPLTPSNYTP